MVSLDLEPICQGINKSYSLLVEAVIVSSLIEELLKVQHTVSKNQVTLEFKLPIWKVDRPWEPLYKDMFFWSSTDIKNQVTVKVYF